MISPTDFKHYYGRPVAIVLDDHTLYAETFSSFLEKMNAFRSVYIFSEEKGLLAFLSDMKEQPEIIVFTDYYLGGTTSMNTVNDLKRIYRNIKIIMVSSVTNPILVNDILNYRIDGFLSKSSNSNEIADCLEAIGKNKKYISSYILKILSVYEEVAKVPFSAREIEILGHFAAGLTVNATAEKMILSRHTIVSHRRRMMAKTNSNTITELLAYARKIDLI